MMNVEPHAPLRCCTYAVPAGGDDGDSIYVPPKGKSPPLYGGQCRDKGRKKKCGNMSWYRPYHQRERKRAHNTEYFSQKENIVAMISLTPVHGFPRPELLLLWTIPNL